jgi:hypothetical protein
VAEVTNVKFFDREIDCNASLTPEEQLTVPEKSSYTAESQF